MFNNIQLPEIIIDNVLVSGSLLQSHILNFDNVNFNILNVMMDPHIIWHVSEMEKICLEYQKQCLIASCATKPHKESEMKIPIADVLSLTQREAAKKMGISASALSRVINSSLIN